MPVEFPPADRDDLVRRYLAGETKDALRRAFGVHERVVRRALVAAGVPVRGISEDNRRRFAAMTDEQRSASVEPMVAALRAHGHPPEWRVNQAISLERTLSRQGQGEVMLAGWLHARGLEPIPQQAIDRYNIDLGLLPVAVELFCGPTYPLRRPQDRRKTEYLLNRGIHVLYVWVSYRHFLSPRAADEVVAFLEAAKGDPSPIGQYRVVRGCGEFVAAGRGDFDQVTIEPARGCAFQPRRA